MDLDTESGFFIPEPIFNAELRYLLVLSSQFSVFFRRLVFSIPSTGVALMPGKVDTLAVFILTAQLTLVIVMELQTRFGFWLIPSLIIGVVTSFIASVWIVTGVIHLTNMMISCVNDWLSK